MQTFSVNWFDYDELNKDAIVPLDIAWHLSMQCRFTGACKYLYTVAQHSVLVSYLVPPELALDGLLHDAREAYTGDPNRPFKQKIGEAWYNVEDQIAEAVADRFGIAHPTPVLVKEADARALYIEAHQVLLRIRNHWTDVFEPLITEDDRKRMITPKTQKEVFEMFINRWSELVDAPVCTQDELNLAKQCWEYQT